MNKLYINFGGKNINESDCKLKMNKMDLPWTEKYRPKKIDEIILDKIIYSKIKEIIDNKIMPNLIITGSPGTGKTSTILCIARNVLNDYYSDGVIELNASDNRGLDTINNNIIHFCKKKLKIPSSLHKIIILDEADNVTKKAQNVLSNLMEQYEKNTRFAFTCNDSSKIIESLQSRCMIFRYNKINNENMILKLKDICKKENVSYTEDGLNSLIFLSDGDIRQCINNLESIYIGYNEITEETVYKICDQPSPVMITPIINSCLIYDLNSSIYHLSELKKKGYCNNDILLTIINVLKSMNISEKIKIEFIGIVSDTYIIINDGNNTQLQLFGSLAKMCKAVYKYNKNK